MRRSSPLAAALLALSAAALPPQGLGAQADEFRRDVYDRLHASPLQERFRRLAPMPIGAVYVQAPTDGEPEMRAHFRAMKRLGFTALKQVMVVPGWTHERVMSIALEEGIIPWWYGEGGWEPITDDLLRRLGISPRATMAEIREDPRMIRHQNGVLQTRIRRMGEHARANPHSRLLSGRSVAFSPQVGGRGFELTPEGERLFLQWVRRQYGTIDRLNHAYNQRHAGLQATGGEGEGELFRSWEDFEANWKQLSAKEYRHLRDILRFKADNSLENNRRAAEAFHAFDPHAPYRGGGELGLFHPQTWYGVDLEGVGDILRDHGSFYPSMHFAWHYDEVEHEIVRPAYMQASLANDLFKGGWAAAWEATGGPQQFSGGKGGNGFTVDENVLTQFLLSQVAAGFKGFGLWTWSARTAGWEAGEYALVDRQGRPTERAVQAGRIGQAMRRYRQELWDARKEPHVGVFVDWDGDAIWTAMTGAGRDDLKDAPMTARVGVSRALMDADVPFEYVTASDLRNGLAPRYRVIYLPATLAISPEMLAILERYVREGGRLVMDTPGGYYDTFGALLPAGEGSALERLFGAVIRDYQYSGVNVTHRVGEMPLAGFTLDLQPTTATVVERYADGRPAATEHRLGRGTAVMLGWEASRMAFRQGNDAAERKLRERALGAGWTPRFGSAEALVYRLASPAADHYFLINDGPATQTRLETPGYRYRRATDAVMGSEVALGAPVAIPAHGGRWLRLEK